MKKYLFFLLFFLMICQSVLAEGLNIRFALHYAAVKHSLKGDEGAFDKLLDISEINQKAAEHLSNFWWGRCLASCEAEKEQALRSALDKWQCANPNSDAPTEEEKEIILREVFDKIGPLIESYIYDHWGEINETIISRWKQVVSGED